jgi:acyl carrier protein
VADTAQATIVCGFLEELTSAMTTPAVSELHQLQINRSPSMNATSSADSPLAHALAPLAPPQRREHAEAVVLRIIRGLTGESAAVVDVETPLMEAGVDSLAATELSSRLRSLTGVALSPTLVFEQPTPRAVAAHLVELVAEPGAVAVHATTLPKSSLITSAGVPADACVPVSSFQHQLVLHQQLQPQSTAYNEPVTVTPTYTLAEPIVRAALQALVRRHAALRTYYGLDIRAAALYQVVLPEDSFVVPLVCCAAEASWSLCLDRELRMPFDLFAAPPIRAIQLQADPPRLVVNVHHVAADMDAIVIIRAELAAHCAALALHRLPPPLPPLEFEYVDFALWEQSRGLDASALSWWSSQLQGAPELLDLPLDRPRPDVQATDGRHTYVHLDPDLTAGVGYLCVAAGATLNSALLTVWSAMLLHLSGQTDVVVGLPHSMRCGANTHPGLASPSSPPAHMRAGIQRSCDPWWGCLSTRCPCGKRGPARVPLSPSDRRSEGRGRYSSRRTSRCTASLQHTARIVRPLTQLSSRRCSRPTA